MLQLASELSLILYTVRRVFVRSTSSPYFVFLCFAQLFCVFCCAPIGLIFVPIFVLCTDIWRICFGPHFLYFEFCLCYARLFRVSFCAPTGLNCARFCALYGQFSFLFVVYLFPYFVVFFELCAAISFFVVLQSALKLCSFSVRRTAIWCFCVVHLFISFVFWGGALRAFFVFLFALQLASFVCSFSSFVQLFEPFYVVHHSPYFVFCLCFAQLFCFFCAPIALNSVWLFLCYVQQFCVIFVVYLHMLLRSYFTFCFVLYFVVYI